MLLARAADAVELSCLIKPQSGVDSHRVPFCSYDYAVSTKLLAEFRVYRIALVAYWVNLLLLGIALYFSWVCAEETGVGKDDMPKDVPTAIKRRIVIGQGLYACGALLGIVSTYLGIAFIVLL